MVVSFDLFGTLIDVRVPPDPAVTLERALTARGVSVPADWSVAYGESHIDVGRGCELSLTEHVMHALKSRGIEADREQCASAVASAFAPEVSTRSGALAAVEAATQHGPVGICSNCSVRGLVSRALAESEITFEFDAVVTSVGCGWRKPDVRAFETVATRLDADVDTLVHVGDDPETDGGVEAVGGTFIDVTDSPLGTVSVELEAIGDERTRR